MPRSRSSPVRATCSLTSLIRCSLLIFRYTYGLIPPFLGDIRLNDTGGIEMHQSIHGWQARVYTASIITTALTIASGSCVILLKKLFCPQTMLHIDVLFTMIFIQIVALVVAGGALIILFIRNKIIVLCFNKFMEEYFLIERELLSDRKLDVPGLLLSYYMIGIVIFGTPLPVLLSIVGLDPIQVLLNEFLLPHPYYQTLKTSIVSSLISLIVTAAGMYISLRCLGLILILIAVLGVAMQTRLRKMLNGRYSECCTLKKYLYTRMYIVVASVPISYIVLVMVVWSQLFLTMLDWVSVNCWGLVPVFFTATTTAAFVGGFGLAFCYLQLVTDSRLLSLDLVEKKNRTFFGHTRDRYNYYYTVKWRAQQPLCINCGSHFPLNKNSLINYVNVLNTNVTNAILLIKP